MFIDDRIEQIAFQLQEELENTREKLKAIQDENAMLKTDIDLYRKADAEKTEKITRLSEELDALKYTNLILRTNAATWRLNRDKEGNEDKIKELEAKIETLENDRSELLERVSKSDEENQELKKKVQALNNFIQRI